MFNEQIFKDYAIHSVKADRFFHAINAYGNNHSYLKSAYECLEKGVTIVEKVADVNDEIESIFQNFRSSYSLMRQLAMTNIFNNQNDPCNLGDMTIDISQFSYLTCYCYQWSLFETFVKNMVNIMIESNSISFEVKCALTKLSKSSSIKPILDWFHTSIFENTPFMHLLPLYSHLGEFNTKSIEYGDLDRIRRMRNKFIHAITKEYAKIGSENMILLHRQYDEDMWVLRLFAGNLNSQIKELINK